MGHSLVFIMDLNAYSSAIPFTLVAMIQSNSIFLLIGLDTS